MTLAALVLAAVAATGQPCAAIDNTTDRAAWKRPGHALVTTSYADNGGPMLDYRRKPSSKMRPTVLAAEASLQSGKPGPKRRIVCGR